MKQYKLTELHEQLKEIIQSVTYNDEPIIVKDGESKVVLLSLSEYNSWKETEYVMSTKANRIRLSEAIERVEKGVRLQKDLII